MPLFREAVDIDMVLSVKMPPSWSVHIVMHHRGWNAICVHIQICVAVVHERHAKHDCIAGADGFSQRHENRTDVHVRERFVQRHLDPTHLFD